MSYIYEKTNPEIVKGENGEFFKWKNPRKSWSDVQRHLFIDLPKIEPQLRKWMELVQSGWSDNARTMSEAWLKEGLRKRCITRDLKLGIKVPLKGFEDKVFYSWFDAPIGYIGITKENREDWNDWWHDNVCDSKCANWIG